MPVAPKPAANGAGGAGGGAYAKALGELNAQFLDWVTANVSPSLPPASLAAGARDYVRYTEELAEEHGVSKALGGVAAGTSAVPSAARGASPANESAATLAGASPAGGSGGMMLPKPGSTLLPKPKSFLDSPAPPGDDESKPASLFPPAPAPPADSPFGAFGGFGSAAPGAAPAAGAPVSLFGNAAAAPAPAPAAAAAGADGEEAPDEPPSPSIAGSAGLADGEEAVYEMKVKVYTKEKASDAWREKGGAGTFKVCRQVGSSAGTKESKPRVLLTTGSLGTVRLNAALHAGVDPKPAKNNVLVTLMVAVEPELKDNADEQAKADAEAAAAPPVARMFCVKCKNPAAATALANAIKESVPKA
uniref:RanBD1 domain-containing protein n=1 Tax=Prasinoderma coloniale TaxID=156133 RepID=A0A7R9TFF6_9VIRI|mmetsp:Transcript_13816/g.57734  ORF Transcript_13816/g.57734 Transcript_13816/m.57734 type:complete len:361 (+) Transcript_13816:1-1083(+)